ncbi:hypothetical protein [Saccharopolyspora spinosa]|uniref:hypothetical protein n=1 Tax=Saccharopolyspora spinosa TaxID=60894 RepID=UPI000237B06F
MAARDVAAGPPLTRTLARAARAVTASVEQVVRPEGLTFDQWLVVETWPTKKAWRWRRSRSAP